jgi:hypothetical protein
MNKNKVEFETTVLDYLSPRCGVRRERLIEYLMESHPSETGYSEPSINRKLANMQKRSLILIEKDPDVLAQYGIKKEAENASYIFAKGAIEMVKHLDIVSNLLKKGNNTDIKMALDEFKRYEKDFFLDSNHLDDMVLRLDNEDAGIIDYLLYFLHTNITKKEIKPTNKTVFLDKLKNLLERYPDGHTKYTLLRYRVIGLLGDYGERVAVIEQLKKDNKEGRLSKFKNDYCDWTTAKVIEEARTELFFFENKLRKEGDTENANTLAEIRNQAKNLAETPTDLDEFMESETREVDQKPNLRGLKKCFDKHQKKEC